MKDYPVKNRTPDRRFDRNSRQFEHPQYNSYDRQNPNYRKRTPHRKNDSADALHELIKQTAPALKTLLEDISASHKRLADAEDRKAAALETIAASLQHTRPGETAPPPVTEQPPAAPQTDAGPAALTKQPADEPAVKKADLSERHRIFDIIGKMHKKGATFGQIAARLEDEHLPTFSGRGKWHAQTVHRLCKQIEK